MLRMVDLFVLIKSRDLMKKGKQVQQQQTAFVERPAEEPQGAGKRRVALKMDAEGDVIWDGVEPEDKASVIAGLLSDSDAQQAFAATAAEAEPAGGWVADDAAFVINALFMFNAWAFTRLKIDRDIAQECTAVTEEQHKILDERGARLLNKWLPGDFLYKDEIMFAGMLSNIFLAQFQAAVAKQKERHGPIVEGSFSQPVNGHAKTPVATGGQ